MAKVIKCLDANCANWIRIDDGRIIRQPKEKCDGKLRPNFNKEFKDMLIGAKETIYTSKELFKNPKEGEELTL